MSDSPLRLTIDGAALVANWRWYAARSEKAACGAAVKANGYGLGARDVVARLAAAGCRDFFVSSWDEAEALGPLDDGLSLSVLHGLREADLPRALAGRVRPVLNTTGMVARWKAAAGDRPCDLMVDTGMNRLGLSPAEAGSEVVDGLRIATLMSHLACADTPEHPLNAVQAERFAALTGVVAAERYSLSNSAGICLGAAYRFDLTRPGIGLYGGEPGPGAEPLPVVGLSAEVLQVRAVEAGDAVGYGADFVASGPMQVATLNIGYADGYRRAFAGVGTAVVGGEVRPLIGRVSMDLVAVDVTGCDVVEGDWVGLEYHLPTASALTGVSQYELLTGLGRRYARNWV
ncbi:alanine racemase [Sphingomonas prati]|uniref:Alanine racemase n=1 Tax=Sphingomonas prati TaxID=1843237 RepID=A0A7W9BSY2_9SPHN|nr:alanine racemase [Sphingomonas prati]MBB5729554.1 alanine racemase [Sphingomonas prati]GGE76575.1 alanine racemase [Sphingomonas prati]